MLAERNDAIEDSVQEPVILEEGDYVFTVIGIENGRHPGGKQAPPCNMMTLTLQVETEKGIAVIQTDLFLYEPLIYMISAYYRCVLPDQGRKPIIIGSPLGLGCSGLAHFKPQWYQDNDGNKKQVNELVDFYDRNR